jgi:hypothetical protein
MDFERVVVELSETEHRVHTYTPLDDDDLFHHARGRY